MTLEKTAWYQSLRYGNLYERLDYFAERCRFLVKLLAIELVIIGGIVVIGIYTLKTQAGYFVQTFFLSVTAENERDDLWKEARGLKSLNLDGCLDRIMESLMNSFGSIFISGLLCFILTIWRSKRFDYTSLVILALAFVVGSRELKSFDNVFTPLQNSTMMKIRGALVENQKILEPELMSTLYILMQKGQCCGVIGGSDMKLFYNSASKQNKLTDNTLDLHPFFKICRDQETMKDSREMTGCYVAYFETIIKPFVRSMFGLAMLTEIIMFSLLVIQSEIPASKEECLRVMFCDRKPSEEPIDFTI